MRFGGHQTFSIRDGWLYKALQVLVETPDSFDVEYLRDRLGVGKNMARSIQHWVRATGLANAEGRGRNADLHVSELGRLVWEYDRFLLHPGTWWLIHTTLVTGPTLSYSWTWFFNQFSQGRFERAVVVEGLRRHIQAEGSRMPSLRTLERDVACMLRSYSRQIPREASDPEDNLECPMVDLDLMTHSRQSGFFQLNRDVKPIPFAVFGWVTSRRFAPSEERQRFEVSLSELTYEASGPGRIFALSAESMFDLLGQYETEFPDRIALTSQAGERILRLSNQSQADWLEEYFSGLPDEEPVLASRQVA